jgi:hypothetical protein
VTDDEDDKGDENKGRPISGEGWVTVRVVTLTGLLGLQYISSGLKLGQLGFRFHRVHRSPSDRSVVVTVAIIDEGLEVGFLEIPIVTVFPFELQETTVGQIPYTPLGGFKFFCCLFKVQYIFHLSLKQRTSFVPVAPGRSHHRSNALR